MKTRERDVTLGALSQGSMLLSSASTIYRMSLERPKKDLDRDPQFQERNWKRIQEGSDRMQRTFD
ncbi:S46 family peptidase, partial [Acidobacteria bacterium ACD]|nr:S46 family peptidase [Acidobacteria bacterium ACD]